MGDLTNDGKVDFADLGEQTEDWVNSGDEQAPAKDMLGQAGDLNRDGIVDMTDFALFGLDWLKQTSWYGV